MKLLKTEKNKKKTGAQIPLNIVLNKGVIPPPFSIFKAALEAFKALKAAFTSTSLLHYFNENKSMRVETDTSAFTIDEILTQQFEVDSQFH